MPDLLNHFLQVVLASEQPAITNHVQWLILSFGQDIMYGATKDKIKNFQAYKFIISCEISDGKCRTHQNSEQIWSLYIIHMIFGD